MSEKLDRQELVSEVKAELNKEKAQEEMQQQLNEAKATLEELRPIVETKNEEIAALKAANEQLQESSKEEIEKLSAKIEELEAEKKSLQDRAEAAEGELADNKAREMLQERVNFLSENDILRSTEEAQLAQLEKVSGMSDEEFENYCADLIDIRLKVEDEEEKAKAEEKEEEKDEKSLDSAAEELVNSLDLPEDKAKATADFFKSVLAQATKKSAQEPKVEEESKDEEAALNLEEAAVIEPAKKDFSRLSLGLTERI